MTDNYHVSEPEPVLDEQDPLPETDWFWRRLFTFIFTLLSTAFVWYGLASLQQLRDADSIYRVTRYMIGVQVMLITYYMVAPSAEQIIKIVQSAKLLRSGIPITRSAATRSPQKTRTEAKTVSGREEPPATSTPSPAPPAGGLDAAPEEAPWS